MARHWIRQEYELLNLVAKEFLEGLRHDGLPIGDARSVHEQLRDKVSHDTPWSTQQSNPA